jgi:carbonic anhydrase/acetyltransferase-like protein (isoleucine patch superfamily)
MKQWSEIEPQIARGEWSHIAPDYSVWIGPKTLIAADARIGSEAVIETGARIGMDAWVGAGAVIGPKAVIATAARIAWYIAVAEPLLDYWEAQDRLLRAPSGQSRQEAPHA